MWLYNYLPFLNGVYLLEHDWHVIFLGLSSDIVYPNGISCTMPEEHQVRLIHSIIGLEKAQIVKPGLFLLSLLLERKKERKNIWNDWEKYYVCMCCPKIYWKWNLFFFSFIFKLNTSVPTFSAIKSFIIRMHLLKETI